MQTIFKETENINRMDTKHILKYLKYEYCLPKWALFTEVGNGTGSAQTRRADAIAVALWESFKMLICGFEIKSNRSDWLKELKTPEKANEMIKYCNKWYVVANEGIVREEELPENWGWYEADNKNKRLFIMKPAILQENQLDNKFVACVLRRAAQTMEKWNVIEEMVNTNGNYRVQKLI
jgi:hypothetical protein